MRICILTHTIQRHSKDKISSTFMHGLAEGISFLGNDVFVLTPYSSKFKDEKRFRSYKLIIYKYIWPDRFHLLGYSETLTDDKRLKWFVYLLSPLMYFFGFLALFKLVKKERIDIINAHWILPNGFIANLVSKVTGVPVVSTLPGSDVYMAGKNNFFRWKARFAAKNSKVVTSNSPQLLRDLKRITNLDFKVRTIIYGVDPKRLKPSIKNLTLLEKLKIKKDQIIILGVGRLVAKKGFSYLIEASQEVFDQIKNVAFVIVGDGDQKNFLENLAKKRRVYKKFRFVGSVDYNRLTEYYNLADIFILPSIRDEKGNLDDQSVSVVDAMSCGKPIITTNFPGYRVVVKDGINGFLIKEKNVNGIAGAIVKLAKSRHLRERMGKESRRLVLEKFSWNRVAREYINLYEKILFRRDS